MLDAVTKLARWDERPAARRTDSGLARGRGVASVHYENTAAYVATIANVSLDLGTGAVRVLRLAVALDCGCIVNPDGLRNQIEGNAIQALSRTPKEQVTFDTRGVTSIDWRRYPIVHFSELPEIAIALLDRPHEPVLGTGDRQRDLRCDRRAAARSPLRAGPRPGRFVILSLSKDYRIALRRRVSSSSLRSCWSTLMLETPTPR